MENPPRCFDQLTVGDRFRCGPRQVSRDDIDTFTEVSGDRTALHVDDAYAATTPFGGVVAHGVLNLAVSTGLAYRSGIFEGTVLAVRAMDVRFERPVRPGDSLTLELVVEHLDEQPRADRGRVSFGVTLTNQDGRTVLSGTWALLLRRTAG